MSGLVKGAALAVAFLAAALLLLLFWVTIAAHLATFFGFNNGGGNTSHYLFWSGAGSDLAYLSFLAAAVTVYRRHNCAKAWCPRIGKHEFTNPDTGIKRLLCWKHHPDVTYKTLHADVIAEIQRKRHLYVGKQPGHG